MVKGGLKKVLAGFFVCAGVQVSCVCAVAAESGTLSGVRSQGFAFFNQSDSEKKEPKAAALPRHEGSPAPSSPEQDVSICIRIRDAGIDYRDYLFPMLDEETGEYRYDVPIWCEYNRRLADVLVHYADAKIKLSDGTTVSREQCVDGLKTESSESFLSGACTALWRGDKDVKVTRADLQKLVLGL